MFLFLVVCVYYTMRDFIICSIHQMLLWLSDQEAWDRRGK